MTNMFCPKCGAQAAENAKFCRSCGTDLEPVTAALTGKLILPNGKKLKVKDGEDEDSRDPDRLWNSFIQNSLIGAAFIVIAIILTVTNAANGARWGFWMLIPGAACLGSGLASYFKAKRIERRALAQGFGATPTSLPFSAAPANLPPARQTFADYAPPAANTDELVVPRVSVTEGTTRHLTHETENPTALFETPEKR